MIDRFGDATDAGAGALFVGAGLSAGAGLPAWGALLRGLTDQLDLPASLTDLPLLAEYCQQAPGGRSQLEHHILTQLETVVTPGRGHELLAQLPIREIWTTNYDELIETVIPDAFVAVNDEDLRDMGARHKSVIKMHGSAQLSDRPSWKSPPVITRGDYERYETQRPRMWAQLRASYLTRTMLFLGFSFADPNINILLRLARLAGTAVTDRHLTVLRRPSDPLQRREHDLLVRDLETSGVTVCEIDEFAELVPVLEALVRRTQPLRCFLAGSGEHRALYPWCTAVAAAMNQHQRWELASLAGDAGRWVTQRVAAFRRAAGTYEPERLLMYFRPRAGAVPPLEERAGTAIYTDLDRNPLATSVVDSCRAMLVLGGGDRTDEEVNWARARGVGVVPVAASGGAARAAWVSLGSQVLLAGREVRAADWAQLDDGDLPVAAAAAVRLLAQAMYDSPRL